MKTKKKRAVENQATRKLRAMADAVTVTELEAALEQILDHLGSFDEAAGGYASKDWSAIRFVLIDCAARAQAREIDHIQQELAIK